MAVSFSPTQFSATVRETSFSASVTASVTDATVISQSATLIGEQEPITISVNGATINISGKYLTGFTDTFTYVHKGSSDKLETPSSTRHEFGSIFLCNSKLYFKLNLQIRFIK